MKDPEGVIGRLIGKNYKRNHESGEGLKQNDVVTSELSR